MGRTVLLGSSVLLALVVACLALWTLTGPAEAAFPGKNGDIVFGGYNREAGYGIYRMRADGSGLRKIAEGGEATDGGKAVVRDPNFSADGRKLVWYDDACGYCRKIFVANANGTAKRALDPSLVSGLFPAWYPSGRKIVYSNDPSLSEGRFDLYVVSLDSNGNVAGAPTRMTQYNGDHYDLHPAVSPDGSKIVFSSDGGKSPENYVGSEIYMMDANRPEGPGNPLVPLTDNTVSDEFPDFSPDGRRVVYSTSRNGNEEIVVMNADGSGKKNLTQNPADDRTPAFSPDGRMIVFVRDASDGRRQIWKMRADGTGQVRLTAGKAVEGFNPDWQPLP